MILVLVDLPTASQERGFSNPQRADFKPYSSLETLLFVSIYDLWSGGTEGSGFPIIPQLRVS